MLSTRLRPCCVVLLLSCLFVMAQGQGASGLGPAGKKLTPAEREQQMRDERLRKQIGEEAFQEYLIRTRRAEKPKLTPDEKALIEAVVKSDDAAVKALLDKGVNYKIVDEDDRSPFQAAIDFRDYDMIQLFLDRGADINRPMGFGTPLFTAANKGDIKLIEWLLARGADVNKKVNISPAGAAATNSDIEVVKLLLSKGATHDVWTASLLGDAAALEKILKEDSKAAMDQVTEGVGTFVTPLHLATTGNHEQAVALLLDAGADYKVKGAKGLLPLQMVTSVPVLKLYDAKFALIKHHHRTDRFSDDDPMGDACWFYLKNGRVELAKYLIEQGVEPDNIGQLIAELDIEKDRELLNLFAKTGTIKKLGPGTLARAIRRFVLVKEGDPSGLTDEEDVYAEVRNPAMVKWLLDQGISVKGTPLDNSCVLNTAIAAQDVDMVKFLLAQGVDINPHRYGVPKEDYDKWVQSNVEPPVKVAASSGNLEILKLVAEKGSDVNSRFGKMPWTALQEAVVNNKRDVAEYLISKGADTNVKTLDGKTLVQIAEQYKHAELAEWLKSKP